MFAENQIQISQAANGWIVLLPYQPPMDREQDIRWQARTMMDEIMADDALKGLKQEPSADIQTPFSFKENHIHVFKTFEEVLTFLRAEVHD